MLHQLSYQANWELVVLWVNDKPVPDSSNEISLIWSHIFTMGTSLYGGPQLSHQIQITRTKFKSLTSNSNHLHQIQIAHIKFKLLASNCSDQIQITCIKFKSFTLNSNRSHQIQITRIKLKLLTSNSSYSHQIQVSHWSMNTILSFHSLFHFTAILCDRSWCWIHLEKKNLFLWGISRGLIKECVISFKSCI